MAKFEYYMQAGSGEVFKTFYPEYHKECKPLARAEGERVYREQVLRDLRKSIKPGDTIYTVLRSVSSSGMSRRISLFMVDKKQGRIACIDYSVSIVTHYKLGKGSGLVAQGCGMDMGYAIVHDLGRALWPDGTKKPHGMRNGQPDSYGGYALRHSWL